MSRRLRRRYGHAGEKGRAVVDAIVSRLKAHGVYKTLVREDPGWTSVFVDDKASGSLAAVIVVYPKGRADISGPYADAIRKIVRGGR